MKKNLHKRKIVKSLKIKVGYFFRKDGDDDFTLPGKEDECGAYVWMNKI